MLRKIRAAAKSWVVILLMGLLVISFAVWGVGDVFTARFGDAVVQAGSREISPRQFQTIVNNYKTQIEQQAQRPVTIEEMARFGVIEQVARELGVGESFAAALSQAGITPADDLVGRQIREQRAFFDPVTGQFSQAQYLQLLGQNNIAPADFEASLRDEVAQSHFASALISGMRAPRLYGAVAVVSQGQARTVSWFAVAPTPADQPAAPTEAQLNAFLQENAARLRRPEFRQLTVVRFSANEQAAAVQVSEAEIARQFQFRRDSLAQPERRSFVQIPVRDAAAGQRVVAALRAGQEPAAVARSVGAEPVAYADQPRTAVVDPAVATVAFSLPAGQVSDVIRGELGLSVVRVNTVTPGVTPTLEATRAAIEQELRTRGAADRVASLIERYEAAHSGGASLVEAARAAGIAPISLPPVAADGEAPNRQPSGVPPQLLQAAFELPQGGESDVLQGGPNEYFAVRVERVIAPAPPPLAEVREPLAQAWRLQRLAERVQSRADALAGRVRSRQPMANVAQSAGLPLTQTELTRQAAVQALGEAAAARVFAARSGEVVVAANTGVFLVARIDRIAGPPAAAAAAQVELAVASLTQAMLRELGEISRRAAAAQIEPRVDVERARQAVGVQTDGATAPAGAAPAR